MGEPSAGEGNAPRVRSNFPGARAFHYLPQLDGIRAFAVCAVILQHARVPFTEGGALGVDVFFVLSGFLITTLLLQEFDDRGSISLRMFYLRRARRLLPALVAVAAFSLVVFTVFHPYNRSATLLGIGASLLYVSCWFRAFNVSELGWFGHTWSLSVEEHFYLVWPPLLLLLCRKRADALKRWILGIFAVSVAYRFGLAMAGVSGYRLYNSPDLRAEQLLAGCALAVLLAGDRSQRDERWDRWWAVLVVLSLLDLARSVAFGVKDFRTAPTLIAVESAIIIGYVVVRGGSFLARLLSHPALVAIGKRSYAMYLWHLPIFGLLFLPGRPTEVRAVGRAGAVVLTFVAAWLSYRFVETRFYRRRVEKSRPESAITTWGGVPEPTPPEERPVRS